jgi:exodeoxyribonuclease V beta subunit
VTTISYRRPEILDRIPLDRHAVIEASAGTGKTFTIEHLVIEILLGTDTRLDQILTVTFTEKATGELRARIRAALENAVSGRLAENETIGPKRPLHPADLDKLRGALIAFERASIHTIHSFCQRTLTELAFHSGARFGVEMVDRESAFHEAFRAELRENLAGAEPLRRLLAQWLEDEQRTIDNLEKLLYEAHWRRYLDTDGPARSADACEALVRSFDAKALKNDYTAAAITRDARAAALAAIDDLARLLGKARRSAEDLIDAVANFDAVRLISPHKVRPGAATKRFPDEMSAQSHAFLYALAWTSAQGSLEVRIADAFLPPIAERLERLKRERGVLDYDDMLRWLWDALSGPQGEQLSEVLRSRFRYGLIDEFQDTDDVQWKIFHRIFVESPGENFLHLIADPKQAIYAFRGADVFAYLAAREELVTGKGSAEKVPLIENFRSTKLMIDAINKILDQDAPFFTGEIKYDNPVTCGRKRMRATRAGKPLAPITLLKVQSASSIDARQLRAALGRKIAATLKKIIAGDKHAIEISDASDKRRTVGARDIMILTRSGADGEEIAGHLRDAGVPFAFYKQEGLFQTPQAGDILDLLRAIAEPHRRSRRLKAWATPFFDVPLRELGRLDELHGAHPLVARLLDWHALAKEERFAELFDALVQQSGLAPRALLLDSGRRELTNYEHIFEVLLGEALGGHLSLAEIIERLASWIAERAQPAGENPNTQRLESERCAVQILTVHKSKGLEADVVVLFGGFFKGWKRQNIEVFHDGHRGRHLALGADAQKVEKDSIDREIDEDDQRLLYVAITRARAKLYLPFLPEKSIGDKFNGFYRWLNDRLKQLAGADGGADLPRDLFEIEPVNAAADSDEAAGAAASELLSDWTPPAALLDDGHDSEPEETFRALAARHAALEVRSYTSLQQSARTAADDVEPPAFKTDLDAPGTADEPADLAGGPAVGIFLHEVIERLDLGALAQARDLESWRDAPSVRELFESAMRRHQVENDRAWWLRGSEIVFNALRSPIAVGGETIESLAACPSTREMDFTFPIPARGHRLLESLRGGDGWRLERGVLVGVVDFVFRHGGRTFFADWKSDRLQSYEPADVERHVGEHYALQALIYTVGVVRLLGIASEREYDDRFGGLLYIFIRGVTPDNAGRRGVYFHRPRFEEVAAYERQLMNPLTAASAARL